MPLLRELLHISMTPLRNNIVAALLTVLYVKVAMETATWLRRRQVDLSKSQARQLVHVAMSSSIVFWPLFDVSHWSWRWNVLVPSVVATRFLYKALWEQNPNDSEVQTLSRSSSPWELLSGPLQLCLLLVWLGLQHFMTPEAAILVSAVGAGDGLAPLIGARYGRHVYRMPLGRPKTMEGSLFVFLGTAAGCYLFPYLLGMEWFPLRIVLAYGGIAAVVEATSPASVDNILVPFVLYFSIDRVDQWMPA